MKKLVFLVFFISIFAQAQEHAWVYFKDKPNASFFLENPLSMLSQRSIDRRIKQNISLGLNDVPVHMDYVASIHQQVPVKAISKWLNAVHIIGDRTAIENLKNLAFVSSIAYADRTNVSNSTRVSSVKKEEQFLELEESTNYQYGAAEQQIQMLGVQNFHSLGFSGKGMQIAVIDVGFSGVNTMGAFQHLRDENLENGEILGGYDYVENRANFYQSNFVHGTEVLSTMGAIKEGAYVGTSPKASYYLFITEDFHKESPLEESLWVQAAEKADSLGVDIINSSLGYSRFDESKYDYSYEDLDGETTFISRGASIAASKGIVVVNSAGNSGSDAWKYITAPADAKNIIAVGAVDEHKKIANFSSFGPTADGRVKPETLAMGQNVFVVNKNNEVVTTNGTSFSSPIIAGVVACLWQAFPDKTSTELRNLIVENSIGYTNPKSQEGYGVLAIDHLVLKPKTDKKLPFYILNFPNEKAIRFEFVEPITGIIDVAVFSALGNIVLSERVTEIDAKVSYEPLSNGIYYVRYRYLGKEHLFKMIKSDL